MAVELEIRDGNPWYLSPDIWFVPGTDPNGPPGLPVVGSPGFLWARVHNGGTTPVSNATVRYYWANPSTMITESTATLVGTSYVTLAPGETKEVLCVTPWVPNWVNGGHECLLAEAFHAVDPLPPRGPNDPFNVPTDRHVAQRNIDVAAAGSQSAFALAVVPFAAANAEHLATDAVEVRVRRAPMATLEPIAKSLGLARLPQETKATWKFGLMPYRCGDQVKEPGDAAIRLPLRAGQGPAPLALAVRAPAPVAANAGALLLVEQVVRDEVVGGIAVLVTGTPMRTAVASKVRAARPRRRAR